MHSVILYLEHVINEHNQEGASAQKKGAPNGRDEPLFLDRIGDQARNNHTDPAEFLHFKRQERKCHRSKKIEQQLEPDSHGQHGRKFPAAIENRVTGHHFGNDQVGQKTDQ